jgi:hypothetical protein
MNSFDILIKDSLNYSESKNLIGFAPVNGIYI